MLLGIMGIWEAGIVDQSFQNSRMLTTERKRARRKGIEEDGV